MSAAPGAERLPVPAEGWKLVLALRQSKRWMLLAAGVIACAVPTAGRAQGKLEAQYTATLAGIPIGKGNWRIDIGDTQYKAAASGSTTGLIRVFLGGQGSSTAHGTLQAGRPILSIYASTIKTKQKDDEVRLKIDNGDLMESKVEPPQDRESGACAADRSAPPRHSRPDDGIVDACAGHRSTAVTGSVPAHGGHL